MFKKAVQFVLITSIIFSLGFANCKSAQKSNASACSRETLKTITDTFFKALEANDPSKAPLASNVRYTENGIVVPVGDGVWKTAVKTTFKRGMEDIAECGTQTQAIIDEKGAKKPMLYGVRLKIETDKISEIEAIVVRDKEVLDLPAILATKGQDWDSILPPDQRTSRKDMIEAADNYFKLFVKEKKPAVSEAPFLEVCDRWENGMQTTKGGMNQGVKMPEHNCSPKGFADMDHPARRFLADEEKGIVVAYVLFNNIWPDFHMFKMKKGKVDLIQAYFEYGKTYKTMGWPE